MMNEGVAPSLGQGGAEGNSPVHGTPLKQDFVDIFLYLVGRSLSV